MAVTESQNHRIAGVGRDLCGSPSPTPLLKQGHPEQAAQDLVQVGLECLQRRRLHNLQFQSGTGSKFVERKALGESLMASSCAAKTPGSFSLVSLSCFLSHLSSHE